jgi:hypothetical protein
MKPSSEEEENENNYQETENVLQKIQEQLKLSEDALNTASYRRSMSLVPSPNINLNQNIVKIKDSSLEFVNIEDDFKNKPKNCPFDDVCSICSSNIYMEKYLCLICKECILCKNCELEHLHPVIKWKNNQLSSLNKIYLFMSNYNKDIIEYNKNNKGGFFGSNKPKFEFKLKNINFEYSMKPNQRLEIPVKISNLNNSDVECSQLKLILFGRNIKDLIVFNKEIKDRIGKEKELKTSISIESGNFCKNYYFDIGLFSSADIELDFNFISFIVKVENEK